MRTRHRVMLLVVATSLAAFGWALPAQAGAEESFVARINAERAARGLEPMQIYWDLTDDARAHSAAMKSQDRIFHNPNLAAVTSEWRGLGENVGVGYSVGSLHDAFMSSPAHRANILGDHNYVGVGVVPDSDEVLWVTVIFMRGPDGLADGGTVGAISDAGTATPTYTGPLDLGLVDPANGMWHLRDGATGATTSFYFGNPGDVPIVGDWDCDGIETPGLYRRSDGYVYLRNSNTSGDADARYFFGNPGDIPLSGDFDGDGCDTVSLYRPAEGRVLIVNRLGSHDGGLGAADADYVFGNPDDKPFVGDFDGDGIETVGLHRESTGLVYYRNSHTQGFAHGEFIFGDPGDRLVAGDWTGNGTDSPALLRPATATMYFRFTNDQGVADATWSTGNADCIPVAGEMGL
jgi:hypothetical protein